jgi:hypothetical protein
VSSQNVVPLSSVLSSEAHDSMGVCDRSLSRVVSNDRSEYLTIPAVTPSAKTVTRRVTRKISGAAFVPVQEYKCLCRRFLLTRHPIPMAGYSGINRRSPQLAVSFISDR